jgi:DNA (cytosine-5)-methyltransferase 1
MDDLIKYPAEEIQFIGATENCNQDMKNDSQRMRLQRKLIKTSIEDNFSLSTVLRSHGLTYDDLQYEDNSRPYYSNQKHFTLDDFRTVPSGIPMVSFFSGAGGLDLGFEALGFDHRLLVEKIPLFCETLRFNRPNWAVSSGDVSNKDDMVAQVSKHIGAARQFDGVFVGGPPCQSFSIAANQRFSRSGENFKRTGFSHETNGNLLFDYIALIKHFKPRAFLIENVPGLMELDNGEQLATACAELEAAGYTINPPEVLVASNYRIPQQRQRLFVIGSRTGKQFQPLDRSSEPLDCGAVFEQSLEGVENHVTRAHSAESVARYMKLKYGARDQLGRVDRLDPAKPSKTIIAGGNAGGGRSHLHPYIPRTLSVRESARIQTFPDDYVFKGPVARQFTQVGNAVPPVLAAQLAKAIKTSFFG